ncbi:hypothetical protein D3C87_2174210 [compost metagenome]
MGQMLLRDAGAVVPHTELGAFLGGGQDQRNPACLRVCMLDGVVKQVQHHLLDFVRII